MARALAADPPLMLMDEPFGAIDPINRERLQNEFLRLQAEIRKTIVFVTHDIDEAIKMGDRIAILQEGGHLAQYAPPAELLAAPANEFVEDFVGADRALKRLACSACATSTCGGWPPCGPAIRPPRRAARSRPPTCPRRCSSTSPGRPLGWLPERTLTGETVTDERSIDPEPVVELDDVLRDALSALLAHDSMYAPRDRRRRRRGRRAVDRAAGPADGQGARVIELLAQLKIGQRSAPGCVENNGFCPAWIADNLDRYMTPLIEHIELTLVSVAIGFVDRVRARCCSPTGGAGSSDRSRRSPASCTRSPAWRCSSCCCR